MLLLFFLMWIIFNGRVTLEVVVIGAAVTALMYGFLCKFMEYSWKRELKICRCLFLILQYFIVLLWEILKANAVTARIILFSRNKNQPVIVRFRTGLKTKMARVVLANSITLTPGTITVSLEEEEYLVHCLDRSLSAGLSESVFVRLLERMEASAGADREELE